MESKQRSKTNQKSNWDEVFSRDTAFFGEEPSEFAKKSLEIIRSEGMHSLLELGCGQGRDTFYFVRGGLRVAALDYAEAAVASLRGKAAAAGLSSSVSIQVHDVRQHLPFPDVSFDACYSHMLLCMELSTAEIAAILGEIHRVLRPGGFALYSVRSSFDKHYRAGTHLREEIYEIGGFAVHFFTDEKIRKLAKGYEIVKIEHLEEGSLPRDLFCITLRKLVSTDFEREKAEMTRHLFNRKVRPQAEESPPEAEAAKEPDSSPGRT